ncbi:hypothetical protein [Pontibacter pudoricolor]|uniref:hypothetical protein n=1 Tax=Pontibacter pudoricolor TaxID=2694930 RepID=UPI001391D12B|nr:hypothetical protein [Pontibacter pudoricolor]
MKKALLFLILGSFASCQSETKATFVITNESEEVLDPVRVKSEGHDHKTAKIKLQPGEARIYLMDMTDLPKVDGEYLLTYRFEKTGEKKTRFGYFTNGFQYEDTIKIFIKPDTVTFDFVIPSRN